MRYCCLLLLPLGLVPAARGQADVGLDETPAKNVFLVVDPGTHTAPIRSIAFAPGGKLLTFGDDRTVQTWDTTTGQRLRVYRMPFDLGLPRTAEMVGGMAVSPDGKTIAVAGGSRSQGGKNAPVALLINSGSGRYATAEGFGHFNRMVFSLNGKRVAGTHMRASSKEEETVDVFNVANPAAAPAVAKHKGPVHSLAFAPDGRLLTGCGDKRARVWNLDRTPASPESVLEHDAPVTAVAWGVSSSGGLNRIVTAAGGAVQVWGADGKKGRLHDGKTLGDACKKAETVEIAELEQLGTTDEFLVAWLAHNKDRSVVRGASLLNLRRGAVVPGPTLEGNVPGKHLRLAVSATGDIAALTDQVQVMVWKIAVPRTARLLTELAPLPVPGWGVPGKKWGPDGRTIAWKFEDESENKRRMTHALNLTTLEAESNSRGLPEVQGWLGSLRDWTITATPDKIVVSRKGNKSLELPRAARTALLPRSDKDVLLAHTRPGVTLELLDLASGKVVRTIGKQSAFITQTRGAPDGKYLLSATGRRRLLVHSVATGELLLTLFVAGDDWVAWTSQGYYAASPGGERMMGFAVEERSGHLPVFHPVARFRKQMYRPELISLLLEKGSVQAAIDAAKTKRGARAEVALADVLPPRITELKVEPGKDGEVTVRVTADAASPKQPVEALHLRLDGRPVPGMTKLFKEPVEKGASATWTLKLPPGSHRIAVVARGKDTGVVTEYGEDVIGSAAPPKANSKLHVLAFGVSKYANHGKDEDHKTLNLTYADKDAKEIADVLAQQCADGRQFRLGTRKIATNAAATRKAVLDELKALAAAAPDPADLAVIYFSGHGEKDDDGKLWLLTHEADRSKLKDTCLSGEELKDALTNIPCRVLLILDACHSASLGRARGASNDLAALLSDEAGVFVLVAARGREYALEGVEHQETKKKIENGLCTWALKEALSGKASASPYDGVVYTHDVYQHVYREVEHHSEGRQHPYLGTPFGSRPLPLLWRDSVSVK